MTLKCIELENVLLMPSNVSLSEMKYFLLRVDSTCHSVREIDIADFPHHHLEFPHELSVDPMCRMILLVSIKVKVPMSLSPIHSHVHTQNVGEKKFLRLSRRLLVNLDFKFNYSRIVEPEIFT